MVKGKEINRVQSTPVFSVDTNEGNLSDNSSGSGGSSPPTSPAVSKTDVLADYQSGHYRTLIKRMNKHIESNDPFFSLEIFPPKTAGGVANLLNSLEDMSSGLPLFVDVTWHVGGDPGSEKVTSTTSIASAVLNYCRLETVMHMTCAQYPKAQTEKHLERAKKLGLRNILALRGDQKREESGKDQTLEDRMSFAVDLVRLIRQRYGQYFVIGVAGYPTGHPDAESYEADLLHLKEKVDAGADFVVTQLFFRETQYFKFVQDCRTVGITVPIIPGIMPIQSYDSLTHICKLSKLEVPDFVLSAVEPIKQDDEKIRNYGIWFSVQLCRNLLKGGAPGLHFYTLNRQVATRTILQEIGLWHENKLKILPWKPTVSHHKRCKEDVRPIFWSARPKAYIYRTQNWDEFPNGRWGNSSSPAFGDLKDYYLFCLKNSKPKQELLAMWGGGELHNEKDVWDVFSCFVSGKRNKAGVKVTRLPWNEDDLSQESNLIQDHLQWCNDKGVLTINSQPNVNGLPSTDPIVGWGNAGGFVYQKAYLEFFTCRENVFSLLNILAFYPQITYHIMNHSGEVDFNNSMGNTPIAVTWGVFPSCEILQPTVVDPISFHVWKDEAFDAWISQWAQLFPETDDTSRTILQNVHDTYCLVTLVDNNYPGNCCLWDVLKSMLMWREDNGVKNVTVADLARIASAKVCTVESEKLLEMQMNGGCAEEQRKIQEISLDSNEEGQKMIANGNAH